MPNVPSLEQYLEAGLNAANLRQAAIMNNIANVRTDGYRRFDVSFEEQLKKQLGGSIRPDLADVKPELINPMTTPINAAGNDVSMEREIGELAKNTGKYKTFMRILTKRYEQCKEAIRTDG